MHIDVVWSPDRDEIFAKRLNEDIGRLRSSGFSDKEIKRMIGTFDYVRFWSQWPVWLYPADKLPRGYKWTDGTKYSLKVKGRRAGSLTWTFLPVDNDLYIRRENGTPWMPGVNIFEKSFCYIKNYKCLTAVQAADGLGNEPFLHDCVMKYWHEHRLPLGFVVPRINIKNSEG